jgi:hypothetical protein
MTAVNELHVVEGGDHSLVVTKTQLKSTGGTQEDVDRGVIAAIGQFLAKHGRTHHR